MNGQRIVEAARQYKDVRWCHQGRTKAGIDCIGLVICVAHDLGLSDYDETDYARIPSGQRLQAALSEHMHRVIGPSQLGDVLMMRFNKEPQHVAIVTDLGIIHAYAQARRVVEHSLDELWRARIICAWRFPGMS